MKIDHLAIWANDMKKLREFYLKYFICKSNSKYENIAKQFSSYFLTFQGGTRIELMHRPDVNTKIEQETIGYAHISINIGTRAKVDSMTKKMEDEGVVIVGKPRTTGDGYYESVVLDPEKNKIELCAIDNFVIKHADIHDLDQILYLQKCCYLSEAEIYNDYSIRPITQKLEDIKEDFKSQTILKLEFDNRIIGSVRGYELNGTCFIGKLIVDKYYQNMGFGKQLIHTIEKEFESANRFELFTGSKSTRNLNLYYKLGYKIFKESEIDGYQMMNLEKYSSKE